MHHLIDLETYPLDQPESPEYAALVTRCRARLKADGMFDLPGFLRPAATRTAARAAAPKMASEGFRHARRHNVYFRDQVDGLDQGHPALAQVESVNRTLRADQLAENPVMELYTWPGVARFLAAVMGKAALYCMDDPIARVNIQSSGQGEALNWHFDRSEFTTTILLQAPNAGGQLEYRKNLRDADDPNHDGISAVLQGQDPQTRTITLEEGALNIFCGANTLHRVLPVQGEKDRMVAIFAFFDRPGVIMTPAEQIGFYGVASR